MAAGVPARRLLLLLVLSWHSRLRAGAGHCPALCPCTGDSALCRSCSYNATLKDNLKVFQVPVCCYQDHTLSRWLQKSGNKTLSEVIITFANVCNERHFNLSSPQLSTSTLRITNTSFVGIYIDVDALAVLDLDLSYNKLRYINKGLFNRFTNLRKLTIRKNEITEIFEDSFVDLTKLETLDLSENNLRILADVFAPLINLQHLNLSNNRIEALPEAHLRNALLQQLDVSGNALVRLAPGALQRLPNLARLLLQDNSHLGRVTLVGAGRRLQQLDASRTGLAQVPEAFTHSVRFLSLVGNKISAIRCGDLDSYPLLQSLDFSDNKIISVEDDSLGRLEMLLFLNLNANLLTSVPKSLPDGLKYLSIDNNVLKNLSASDFRDLPTLRILTLKNNEITHIGEHVFDDLLALELLDLSGNPLRALARGTFAGPRALRDLRLCALHELTPSPDGQFPLAAPDTVQLLHLQSSPALARQLLADSAALAAFSHLQYLDLRMNNLTGIRNDLLFYLAQLKTLRLHGNGINCSAELWLRDWMTWNQSLSDGETCYYSSSESKADMTKYNCTFADSFMISESLPPVNLYSTEVINKLLRYYGYFDNDTDHSNRQSDQNNSTVIKTNEISIWKVDRDTSQYRPYNKDDHSANRMDNAISLNEYFNESAAAKAREAVKVLDQNRVQNDQFNIDHRFLDIEPIPSSDSAKKSIGEEVEVRRKNRSGKRLNTPVNVTKKTTTGNTRGKSASMDNKLSEAEGDARTTLQTHKSEFSPFSGARPGEAHGGGAVAAIVAVACAAALLGALVVLVRRRPLRPRRAAAAPAPGREQLEVSSISGGVLW